MTLEEQLSAKRATLRSVRMQMRRRSGGRARFGWADSNLAASAKTLEAEIRQLREQLKTTSP